MALVFVFNIENILSNKKKENKLFIKYKKRKKKLLECRP